MDWRSVARRYLSRWFLIDLLAAIPWDWIDLISEEASDAKFLRSIRLVRALRMIRLVRLLRFAKIQRLLSTLESSMEGNHALMMFSGLIRVIMTLFFVTHW